jgi:hypothetical protein
MERATNRVPRSFLDFDDPGAGDDEPVKGITAGDIRAWHDQYDNILSTWADCRTALSAERGALLAVVRLAGGEVEGHPTSSINILQRIRQLVRIEGSWLADRDQKMLPDRNRGWKVFGEGK